MKELKHETINISEDVYVKKGIYHLQHVNSYHKRLKDWMQRFQGVATKERVNQMLLRTSQKSNLITVRYWREVLKQPLPKGSSFTVIELKPSIV